MKDKAGKVLSTEELIKKTSNRLDTILLEFWVMILRIVGFIPSHFVRKVFYRISGVSIGVGSSVHMGARFYNPENIFIGKDTIIGEGSVLDGRDKLIIGDHVDIASDVMIYNAQHDLNSKDFNAITKPVEIADYVFVGPRAIILPGVKIGKGAVVAAGAVVTKNVEKGKIVGGVPAEVISDRKLKDFDYRLGRAAWFS